MIWLFHIFHIDFGFGCLAISKKGVPLVLLLARENRQLLGQLLWEKKRLSLAGARLQGGFQTSFPSQLGTPGLGTRPTNFPTASWEESSYGWLCPRLGCGVVSV